MTIDWTRQLVDQLDWHWSTQMRPRLDGLTDDEYFWEPVRGCWNVRSRSVSTAPPQYGSGAFTIDFAYPAPEPVPVTTIAWRLAHILVGVLGARIAGHFGGPPVDYQTYDYPGTADDALTRLDALYATWRDGVAGKDEAALAEPCGPAEGPWGREPFATLVLHINREVLHHCAEIALLRDLYRRR